MKKYFLKRSKHITPAKIRKRHESRLKYIKKMEAKSRWMWDNIHKSAHNDLDSLLDDYEALEERYSWAIQLCDDNNMPPWKERYEAEIDIAIKEDHAH